MLELYVGIISIGIFWQIRLNAGCGITTHINIAHRARDHYRQVTSSYDYRDLIDRHEDAFLAGIPYPDSFYNGLCANGIYHDVSEDTHWGEFLNATINYIRKQPKPWDQGTEKLVVFMMGFLSHQVADILWHSLGIDQGFLTTMGYVDFHGSYSNAHTVGDIGGDLVVDYMYEMNKYIDPVQTWYVPVDDLYNIYKEFYGTKKINKTVIKACPAFQLLLLIAELIGGFQLFEGAAYLSPFLVDNMMDYFEGGVQDMAGWTNRKWHDAVTMLENGTSACDLPHNTLFVHCPRSGIGPPPRSSKEKNGYFIQRNLTGLGLSIDDLSIRQVHRGIQITPGPDLKKRIQDRKEYFRTRKEKQDFLNNNRRKLAKKKSWGKEYQPRMMFTVNSTDSMLGWSLASGDIDHDGNEDLVIGAPGYSKETQPQIGRVYVVYGGDNGLVPGSDIDSPIDLDNLSYGYNRILHGYYQPLCKFGYAVEVLDVNLDGKMDVAVGAPSYRNTDNLGYNGMVFIYFGGGKNRTWSDKPDIVVMCEAQFCNLGVSLTAVDVSGDGHEDLVIGSPYTHSSHPQAGLVTALPSSASYKGPGQIIHVEKLTWGVVGSQPYSWFGHSLHAKNGVLMISEPNYRHCEEDPQCVNYTNSDLQSIGKVSLYNFKEKVKISNLSLEGQNQFDSFGYSVDIGDPFGNGSVVLAVGLPHADVVGKLLQVPFKFEQAGSVLLYMVRGTELVQIGHYDSDRRFSRFGIVVKFSDLNHDGIDDLVIGCPYRNQDATDIRGIPTHGLLYGFFGGRNFRTGNATSIAECQNLSPCPGQVANITTEYSGDGTKSFFGNNAAIVKSKNQTQLIVSSSRNSKSTNSTWFGEYGRVYVYNTWR